MENITNLQDHMCDDLQHCFSTWPLMLLHRKSLFYQANLPSFDLLGHVHLAGFSGAGDAPLM